MDNDEIIRELCAALTQALDIMEGMMIGAAILRGESGTIKVTPTPEMIKFRELVARTKE